MQGTGGGDASQFLLIAPTPGLSRRGMTMSGGHDTTTITRECRNCGARQEQIDDNLFPICEPVTGPHRLAIIAVRDAAIAQASAAQWSRRCAAEAEDAAAQYAGQARLHEADHRALQESLKLLKGAEGEKPLPLHEAIRRI